jgi:trans-2,3-dihydro-3-hydroxyanthranilate isomerase
MSLFRDRELVRVFARPEAPGSGNPATVIWCDRDVATADLVAEAGQTGTPATAFIFPGTPLRVRFFTATSELPLCGHGALAAGAVYARRAEADRVELAAGAIRIPVTVTRSGLALLELNGTSASRRQSEAAALLGALGIGADDLITPGPVPVVNMGSPKWLVAVRDVDTLRALRPDMSALAKVSVEHGVNGAYVYALPPPGDDADAADILARGFNPAGGVDEDAATGAAAAALGLHLGEDWKQAWLRIDQGIFLRDLNRLYVGRDGDAIRVGGLITRAI